MAHITGVTRGGVEWEPHFVQDLNQETCIGCGRCFKVCPRDVFDLVERDYDDGDDDFSDEPTMVMAIADPMDCIGCQSCAKVCPKKCHTHAPAGLSA